jgi:hypothetical protein
MSRFSRPNFKMPKMPSPPGPVSRVNVVVARLASLARAIPRVQAFALIKRPAIPNLAQIKAQLVAAQQAKLVAKVLALVPIPPIPAGVQADIAKVTAYRDEMTKLFNEKTASLDEFGNQVGQAQSALKDLGDVANEVRQVVS